MQEVAAAAGVSLSTVDRILNRRAAVKRATVDQVLSAAQRLGYHGVRSIHDRLTENAPRATLGFVLNSRDRGLYAELGHMLADRTRASTLLRAQEAVRHMEGISSAHVVRAIEELAETCDAIAVVAVDTPEVNAAVDRLAARGIPVITMLSDLSTPRRTAFVGADGIKIGRGAGWMIDRLAPSTGTVGLLLGSSDYMAHRAYRDGFRAYLHERGSQLVVREIGETDESDFIAYGLTEHALEHEPDLVAILVAGGGLGGAATALRTAQRKDLVLIGTELSREAGMALSDNLLDVVLSHPGPDVVERTVALMERILTLGPQDLPRNHDVPVDIRTSETL
ncbi:LacI family DNA-binding transcriptional regulator [Paracoccus laeviglucosivorans]|uniref:LacI family transcriptional regulator n=1 Tax=Paracoccus laeviglucosivorans TaxID=1197861 RepID=A0A521FUY7_9RHOB|nr:LacI family DNA-binding transcriptional regulator [Paracoccus laeviglucosivorans]SMO99998.1 LacI family transcriptional regulator [Paracoccus laeviglucosivorans]